MLNNPIVKAITVVILFLIVTSLCGCVLGRAGEPYLDDRTEGWDPLLTLCVDFTLDRLDAETSELWHEIIDFKAYTYPDKLTKDNFSKAADEAMKINLGDSFSEIGKAHEVVDLRNVYGFINNDAIVVFDSGTGRLKFCADLTNNSALKEQFGNLLLSVNAADLTASQLAEIQKVSGYDDAPSRVDLKNISLPLTAQGAYELSVNMDVKTWHGSSRLAATGGAFRIYYSAASDAFFVVTNTYIQALEKSTGELLLMHSYGKVSLKLNEYPYGRDDSLKK